MESRSIVDSEGDPTTQDVDPKLRATSDALLVSLEELYDLETRKREIPPDDPAFLALAQRVDDIARAVLDQARRQERLAREAAVGSIGGETPLVEIDPTLAIPVILERWRAAERRLEGASEGSDEARVAAAEASAYREAYRRAWEARET
jgi:hypothetical protein